MEIKKSQYLKEQEKGLYVCCPICKTVLIRAQKGLDGVIKCSQCGMFVHIVIGDERIDEIVPQQAHVLQSKRLFGHLMTTLLLFFS